jgi:hypothetical protein
MRWSLAVSRTNSAQASIIDEVMRRPATEFKGPKDPDLEIIINYWRYIQMKHDLAKRSEFAGPIDPDLWKIAAEGRQKPKTFRRF